MFRYMKTFIIILIVGIQSLFNYLYAQNVIEQKIKYLEANVESASGREKISAFDELFDFLILANPGLIFNYADQAIAEAKKYNERSAEADFIIYTGHAHAKLHEPLKAIEYYQKANELAQSIKDSLIICRSLIRIGAAKITTGDINEAITSFVSAENIAGKIRSKEYLADALNYLAISYYLIDNFEEANRLSEEALKLSKKILYKDGIALAYEHLAIIKIKLGNFTEALQYNDKAFEIREERFDLASLSGLHYNYAVIYNRLNDFDRAIDYTKRSIELRTSYGNWNGVGSNYLTLGNIYLRANQLDSALFYLKRAYDIKIGTGDTRSITSIVKSLADVYERQNDFTNAYKYLSYYRTYSDSLFGENSRRLASKVLAQQELVRKESEIKHLQDINAYQSELQQFLIIIVFLSVLLSGALVILYINNKKTNQRLNARNEELINFNKDKEKFFKIITHDLRSPFHPIIGYSELILSDIGKMNKDEIKEFVEHIHTSSVKVYDLLDNLLQWLSISTGKLEFKPAVFNLNNEISSIIDLFINNIENKSLTVTTDVDEDLYAFSDKSMFGIVFRNIFSNAIKFSNEKSLIEISAAKMNDFISLTVRDYGIGISYERLSGIFTNEMKSTKGTADESGSGLGLLLCKEMTERNGGSFSIESKESRGTTVTVTIPLSNKSNHLISPEQMVS